MSEAALIGLSAWLVFLIAIVVVGGLRAKREEKSTGSTSPAWGAPKFSAGTRPPVRGTAELMAQLSEVDQHARGRSLRLVGGARAAVDALAEVAYATTVAEAHAAAKRGLAAVAAEIHEPLRRSGGSAE